MIVTKELLRLHEEKRVADAVVDDARMARALEWLRNVVALGFPVTSPEHLPAIEEAIAAYDPNCGGRTVRVVDDAMVERALHSAYYAGWCNAARWADRTDLVCDEGSAAYARDRDVGLALTKTALLAAYRQDNGGKQCATPQSS